MDERVPPVISELRVTMLTTPRTVLFRRRASGGSVLDERVRASALAYRTFVADGKIYTDVLIEDGGGRQEFVALDGLTFMKSGPNIPRQESVATRVAGFVPPHGGF